ncbi:N-acetylmuramic acid 6-phosphate etherase [Microlunatus sp. Y2014]|uniref:N-acetylmuramic acid 6-phosphate etherase n=1 Tax=Microlunatus sp. Y2014 TaxID=3418488 RepID=UPI003DA6FB07
MSIPVTEQVNPDTADIDLLSTPDQVRLMNAQDALVAPAVATRADAIARVVDEVSARMRAGGRLVYIGAGTAGRLGVLDASEIPPTFGESPDRVVGLIAGGRRALTDAVENAEDDPDAGAADLAGIGLTAADSVVGIAASGRTPYVIGALEHARELGAFTAAVSCNPDSAIGRAADVAIEVVVGPEVLTGSTRLKSGTAQKLVLNTITTLTMIKLGKTYGNLMVDLQATNEKLHRRSERLVTIATGCDTTTARTALDACGGSVKTAIAMILLDAGADEAAERLARHDGMLRAALAEG